MCVPSARLYRRAQTPREITNLPDDNRPIVITAQAGCEEQVFGYDNWPLSQLRHRLELPHRRQSDLVYQSTIFRQRHWGIAAGQHFSDGPMGLPVAAANLYCGVEDLIRQRPMFALLQRDSRNLLARDAVNWLDRTPICQKRNLASSVIVPANR